MPDLPAHPHARVAGPGRGRGRRQAPGGGDLSAPRRGPRRPWVIYTDGASRGNPGPAAIGVVIYDPDGEIADEISRTLGRATNNTAEYEAVRSGLQRAAELGAEAVHLRADSELAIRQLTGVYRVKNPGIRPLYEAVKALEARFPGGVTYEHVRRELNTDADALANAALDGFDLT